MNYIKVLLLFMLIGLVGCNNQTDKIKERIELQYTEKDNKDAVRNSVFLPLSIDGVAITWTSESPYLEIKGNEVLIDRQTTNQSAILTASYTFKGKIETKDFIILIKAAEISDETFDFSSVLTQIKIPRTTNQNITLPALIDGVSITWSSSDEAVLSNEGVVAQQSDNKTVTLTALLVKDNHTHTQTYEVFILKKESDTPADTPDYEAILNQITLESKITSNIVLPEMIDDVLITWSSDHDAIKANGVVTQGNEDIIVTLTASAGGHNKSFTVTVLKKDTGIISTKTPIVEVREMALNTQVEIHGVATSLMTNGNFTIQDSTGAIPVYFGYNSNDALTIGKAYIIKGTVDDFSGLIQLKDPTATLVGDASLPAVDDLTGYSLDYDDLTLYEAYVISYRNLEIVAKEPKNNALELTVKNEAGEQTNARLDTRVNTTPYAFEALEVGQLIDFYNVSVGQFQSKAQFLFTNRSRVEARPKDPDAIAFYGVSNQIYTIGDPIPDYLAGITAKNGHGTSFTKSLSVNSSAVDLTKPGIYLVEIYLNTDPTIKTSYQLTVRNPVQPGDYQGYYESLAGLSGSALNQALQRLIKSTGSATGSTSQVQQADRWEGSYYLIYSGMGSYGNREHTWPDSKLGHAPKYDLHNLRAANVSVNSSRGNLPFREDNSPYTGSQPYGKFNGGWYPGDEHIGDVARIILYIHVRYGLSLNPVGELNTFLTWHNLDPVNEFEQVRNDRIYTIQNNRNPFIDHPELVELYFGPAPTTFNIPLTLIQTTLIMNQTNMYL